MVTEKPEEIEGTKFVKLDWGSTEELPTIYANHLYITHSGGEFYIVFGELTPPLELNPEKLPAQLTIKPVAKIAVTSERMIRFAEAIGDNTEKYKEKIEKVAKE